MSEGPGVLLNGCSLRVQMLTIQPIKLLLLKSPWLPPAVVGISNGSLIKNRTNKYFHNIPRLSVPGSSVRAAAEKLASWTGRV